MNNVFHLTEQRNVSSILSKGIHRNYGSNSSLVDDVNKDLVYLTTAKYLPYWQILLNRDVVVEIDSGKLDFCHMDKFSYGVYEELMYKCDIPVECVVRIQRVPKPDKSTMKELCLSHLGTISTLCVAFARYYTYPDAYGKNSDALNVLYHDLKSSLRVGERLDYNAARGGIGEYLRYLGDEGEYTLADAYKNTGLRLYEALRTYPKDKTYKDRIILADWIDKTLGEEAKVDSGGWTG